MANIPIPENDDSLELNVRYQPDMVLEGMLDATVPEFTRLTLTMGDDTYDMLGAQSGEQILELLSEDLTAAEEGKVLTVVEDDSGDTTVYNAEWAEIPDQLPAIEAGDAGKVLTVNVGETGTEWADAPSGLPEISSSDEGKVLTVVESQTETQSISIVPSQTVTVGFSTTVEIDNAVNLDEFVGGATLAATIDAHDYSGTIVDTGNPAISFEDAGGVLVYSFSVNDNTLTFQAAGIEEDTQFTIEAHVVKPVLVAGWKATDGGAVNLDAITTEVQTAAMTAAGNADTSGFFGVSLSMFGTETTVETANLITEAARAGKISALGQNFTLISHFIDEEYPPTPEGMEAYTTISFLVPVIALGLNKYYTLAVQITTGDKRDQQTDEYVPTLAVSCWAMKIANYPSN